MGKALHSTKAHAFLSCIYTTRTVVYWKHGESRPTFINPLNPLYEPLQYPLFYPHRTNGWHINLYSLSPPAYAKISLIEYYHQRNPNWAEIRDHPSVEGQFASDRPDVTSRVFRARLQLILKTLKDGLSGRKVFVLYVIGFQKRGLPHAHIAICVEPEPKTYDEMDQVISAEVPPESDDPDESRYHHLVVTHMMHRRTHSRACLDADGHCRKDFPKSLVQTTYVDDRGYVHYRRQSDEDCWVVPHNRHLLMLAECHINSCTVNLIMYLYKYIFKGPDCARYTVGDDNDEIAQYINARNLSACEAAWRIFGFHLNHCQPSVTPLPIHLPGCEHIIFREGGEEAAVSARLSKLDRYFGRPVDSQFDDVKYCE